MATTQETEQAGEIGYVVRRLESRRVEVAEELHLEGRSG